MKKNYITIFIVFVTQFVFSQKPEDFAKIDTAEFHCIYEYVFQFDSLNTNSKRSELVVVEIGRHISHYTALNNIFIDSVLEACASLPEEISFQVILPQVQGMLPHPYNTHHIYKHYPYKDNLYTAGAKATRVTEQLSFDWEIVSNSDTLINGFNCNMATTQYAGRAYKAWFCPDIPINDGPYKFYGLPGLIINIEDTAQEHCFKLQNLKKISYTKPVILIAPSSEPQVLCVEEYVKAINARMAALSTRMADPSITQTDDESVRARAVRKVKSINNYIELYGR